MAARIGYETVWSNRCFEAFFTLSFWVNATCFTWLLGCVEVTNGVPRFRHLLMCESKQSEQLSAVILDSFWLMVLKTYSWWPVGEMAKKHNYVSLRTFHLHDCSQCKHRNSGSSLQKRKAVFSRKILNLCAGIKTFFLRSYEGLLFREVKDFWGK